MKIVQVKLYVFLFLFDFYMALVQRIEFLLRKAIEIYDLHDDDVYII